ncbi:hypothetical protein BCV72DRAFT_329200, partial [Rhizopus microsporus var. microsporus]
MIDSRQLLTELSIKSISMHLNRWYPYLKITHANHKSALNMIAQENVASDQQRMIGR